MKKLKHKLEIELTFNKPIHKRVALLALGELCSKLDLDANNLCNFEDDNLYVDMIKHK